MKPQAVTEMLLPGLFRGFAWKKQTQLMLSQSGVILLVRSLDSLHGLPDGGATVATLGWGRRPISYLPSCCDKVSTFLCAIPTQIAISSGKKHGVGNGSSHGLPLKCPEALSWCAHVLLSHQMIEREVKRAQLETTAEDSKFLTN